MAERKKKNSKNAAPVAPAVIHEQPITETLRENYMPYAMSSIISRAIPEIDGLKPSHRKLLYTMYKMGLLNGPRTKSANVVGQTMKLNPHGDAAIYETMVRLTRGNEALLHPFVDSKGTFGKQYSKMAYAASRYTEVKLAPISAELFAGIDREAVDMVDNYDATLKEPVLLPSSFPNVLVCPNTGIAVGLASSICSFNLNETCDAAIALMRDPNADLYEILKAPDFSTGGELLYDKDEIRQVYETGKGSFSVRAVWENFPKENRIVITQIPYNTTVDQIIEKIVQMIKEGKLREINDVRDEIDLDGLKLTIDLKRGSDPDKLMAKLLKATDLECRFPCNFNILIAGSPHQLGVRDILNEWHAFRCECLKREFYYELGQKETKLHLLQGLEKILVDIDKAIAIIRKTEQEKDVIPNLCRGFDIDEPQAEYIAEIKLRHLNRQYILDRIGEREKLEKEIAELEGLLSSARKLDNYIIKQLEAIKKKYGQERKTRIAYEFSRPSEKLKLEEEAEYTAHAVITREGYLKNIPLKSIMMNDQQRLKEDDTVVFSGEMSSKQAIYFFTDKGQVYPAKFGDFSTTKSSELGDYIPARLEMDPDEKVIFSAPIKDLSGKLAVVFENGKGVCFPMSVYETKGNRKKLTGAFSTLSPVAGMFLLDGKEVKEILLKTKTGRACILKTTLFAEKSTRTSAGNQMMALKKNDIITEALEVSTADNPSLTIYKKPRIPTPGIIYNEIDMEAAQGKMEL
ncbi:MAG: topoisomerase IV [Ruminococcaceae bacterium]|nr:topoisomerase IV [Oscillospiraceae bacterium]